MNQSDWRAIFGPRLEIPLWTIWSRSRLGDVYLPVDPDEIRALVGGPLPEQPTPPQEVIAALARDLEPYIAAHSSGRYFGFVIGGLHPAAYGAELLTSTWDQNAGLFGVAPGAAVVEHVAQEWVLDLLDLPRQSSVGFVTGGQMANFTCLAAAHDSVLRQVGWDVGSDGLQGAPRIDVVVKSEKHTTVARALRFLGLGYSSAVEVPSDEESRMDVAELDAALSRLEGPTILCVEAGNVNTGSFDPFAEIADVVEKHRDAGKPIWVHADGAVGLWARAGESRRHLGEGLERLDSWSTDAHKLLNVAYDSGIAICRDASAHRAAMSVHASYLIQSESESARDPMDWNPEFSRRARGMGVYATLRSLGRTGVTALVERACDLAVRFAEAIEATGKAEIRNEVAFNQVLVRWLAEDGDHDAFNDRVMQRVQEDGTAFFSGTTWNGMRLMRLSVSDWATDEDDIDRSLDTLLEAVAAG